MPSRKPVDGAAAAASFKARWSESKKKSGLGDLPVPGGKRAIQVSKVEAEGNKVSIWLTTDPTLSPDFVIVNPPTEVFNSEGVLIEDPLSAIAFLIDGASK